MNSNSIKKYVAEFIGTMVLVVFGCGTAMLVGCDSVLGCGYILTALAFGLVIVAMAYSVGNISGCHINPAVSLGVLLSGGMSVTDFIGYVIAQFAGALAGSGVLAAVFAMGGVIDKTGTYTVKAAEGSLLPVADVQTSFGFGANTMAGVGGNHFAGLIVEIILTAVFVFAILGVTSKKAGHVLRRSGYRSDPHPDPHLRHRSHRYLRQPGAQLRSRHRRDVHRQLYPHRLLVGVHSRSLHRRRTRSHLLQILRRKKSSMTAA